MDHEPTAINAVQLAVAGDINGSARSENGGNSGIIEASGFVCGAYLT